MIARTIAEALASTRYYQCMSRALGKGDAALAETLVLQAIGWASR